MVNTVQIFIAIFLTSSLALLTNCAKNFSSPGSGIVTECVLPEDQSGSLNGRWSNTPIPVAMHTGDFNSSERDAMQAAILAWNDFFQQSKGFPIFGFAGESSEPYSPGASCPAPQAPTGPYDRPIVAFKEAQNWPFGTGAIGVTVFCLASDPAPNGFPRINAAKIIINYKDYFLTNLQPDLKSIFVHELGHLLGMKHSCSNGGETGSPDCGPGVNGDYLLAVMNPNINFPDQTHGEVKDFPRSNDQGRANCLY